jgi:hypothetical protein
MRELSDSYHKLWDGFLAEGQKRFDDYQDEQNRLNAGVESTQQQLRSKFDELARYLDRFM